MRRAHQNHFIAADALKAAFKGDESQEAEVGWLLFAEFVLGSRLK